MLGPAASTPRLDADHSSHTSKTELTSSIENMMSRLLGAVGAAFEFLPVVLELDGMIQRVTT